MSKSSSSQIDLLEASLDAEYASTVPRTRSWELVASHLLFAHAGSAMVSFFQELHSPPPGPWSPSVESRKHGLMHAVRMLHGLDSRPMRGIREHVEDSLAVWAMSFLDTSIEYDAVVSGFTQYRTGNFSVTELSSNRILFSPTDPDEAAHDFIDHFLQSPQAKQEHSTEFATRLRRVVEHMGTPSISRLALSPAASDALMQVADMMKETTWQLPSQWEFKNIPIVVLRRFWTALWLVGTVALGAGFKAVSETVPTWKPVIWMRQSELARCVAKIAGMTEAESHTMLEWHVYDRRKDKSDIALTPFIQTGPDHIITSPELLSTSRFERNFYANAARTNASEIAKMSKFLAPQMASELALAFQKRGFRTATQVPYSSSRGSGDIDLLVWAPEEQAVVAIELKWFTAPADYREVLNLAAKAAQSLRDQLPKYQSALTESAPDLIRRSFGVENANSTRLNSVGFVARNYVGHASLRKQPFWFAPEVALLLVLESSSNLTDMVTNLERFSWLPQQGKDFEVGTHEFVSPGGTRCGIPIYRIPITNPV